MSSYIPLSKLKERFAQDNKHDEIKIEDNLVKSDPIYGTIIINNIVSCDIHMSLIEIINIIINTEEFQKLKYINQTACLVLISNFDETERKPNHSRFEHSLGTMYLALKYINALEANSSKTIGITDEDKILVVLAALTHDFGHSMLSHQFDKYLKKYFNEDKPDGIDHEERSQILIKYIIKKYNISLDEDQVNVICGLIHPNDKTYDSFAVKYKKGKWMLQIVSNAVNGNDVDKMDYINRDCYYTNFDNQGFSPDNIFKHAYIRDDDIDNIVFGYQAKDDLCKVYTLRNELHETFYNNVELKAIEILFTKCLENLNIDFYEYISIPEKMNELIDSFILNSKNEKIVELLIKIENRDIPKLITSDEVDNFELSNYISVVSHTGLKNEPQKKVKLYEGKYQIAFPVEFDKQIAGAHYVRYYK